MGTASVTGSVIAQFSGVWNTIPATQPHIWRAIFAGFSGIDYAIAAGRTDIALTGKTAGIPAGTETARAQITGFPCFLNVVSANSPAYKADAIDSGTHLLDLSCRDSLTGHCIAVQPNAVDTRADEGGRRSLGDVGARGKKKITNRRANADYIRGP